MSTLYICATLLILTLGVVDFIKTTYPPRKSKFVTLPYKLELYKESSFDDIEIKDPLLLELMGEEKKKDFKVFYMQAKFDLADVCSYVEDTLGRFEDEKIFSDCTKVITFQGDTYYLAVPFLKFDEIYEEYLGET